MKRDSSLFYILAGLYILSLCRRIYKLFYQLIHQSQGGRNQGHFYILHFELDLLHSSAYLEIIRKDLLVIYFSNFKLIDLERVQAYQSFQLIEDSKKYNDILSILLPKFVRNRLSQCNIIALIIFEAEEYNLLENQGSVVIVFCDICNFDQIINEEQENVIILLDKVFRKFDNLCQTCGVQKIETVGKTYMASAGLKSCEKDLDYLSSIKPINRAINLADKMMEFTDAMTWGFDENKLVIKIGIHYGRTISGVIGFHKPQFSLIGNTVNTTSRICSTGLEGKITLSEAAFNLVQSKQFNFISRQVEMKGLGLKPTFILIRQSDNNVQGISQFQIAAQKKRDVLNDEPKRGSLTSLNKIDKIKRQSVQDNGFANQFGSYLFSQEFKSYQKQTSNIIQPKEETFQAASPKRVQKVELSQQIEQILKEPFYIPVYNSRQNSHVDLRFLIVRTSVFIYNRI